MGNRLHVVNGSHPCATVMRALELKGIPYRVVELPFPLHPPIQRVLFGQRTVPAIRFDDGEKVSGSRAILRRLDERVPEPPLLPADEEARRTVLRAEEWGDEVLQSLVRRVFWGAVARRPGALYDFQASSRLPTSPRPLVRALAPAIVLTERFLNGVNRDAVRADLRALPGHLNRIDSWISDGVLGGETPNAADLQIAPSVALLATVADVRPLLEGRPAHALGRRLGETYPAEIPAGAFPADWLPAAAAPAAA